MIPPKTAWGWHSAVFAVAVLFLVSFAYTIAVLVGVI